MRLHRDLAFSDREQEAAGDEEARRVDQDRVGRGDELDQAAREARARELRARARHLELRVALHQALPLNERRQVRLVRDVEEDREDSGQEADDV